MKNQDQENPKFSVLIVDDIPQNIQVISNILYKKGVNVSIAMSGKQALDQIRYKAPDLILLDIAMPQMNGFEVCNTLKSDNEYKEIPIIFLTAKSDKEIIVEAFECGAADYVTKPFNGNELLARVFTQLDLQDKTKKLKEINSILEVKVAERTEELKGKNEELEYANQQLEQLDKAKTQFLHVVNHELRTPLNGILAFSQMLDTSKLNDDQAEFIKYINISAERLNKLSEIALLITTLQADYYDLNEETLDIKELLQNVLLDFETTISDKKLTVSIASDDIKPNITIKTDKTLITTCITMIIDNAVKFSKDGSEIEINLTRKDALIQIQITNSGEGFDPSILESRIKMFTSGDKYRESTGFGLGLSTAFLIAEYLEMRIELENIEGKGARVSLFFEN